MKKTWIFILCILVLSMTGCTNKTPTDASKFKEEYESVNKTTNSLGKEHRTVEIDEENPFIYITPEELIEKINKEETFYIYFGSKLCPWCRSMIEEAIKVAKEYNINTIYYIDIWDDEGNEILRDQYTWENDAPKKIKEGTESYNKLLTHFDNVLPDYTLTDEEGTTKNVGEKRIYAPNFIYVENGKSIKLTDATSDTQKDSREELTEEIRKEQEEKLKDFFA